MDFVEKIKQTQALFAAAEPSPVSRCPEPQPEVKPEPKPEVLGVKKTRPTKTEPQKTEPQKKKTWIEIMLVDREGKPMPGVRYRITPPAGDEPSEGMLNEFGQAGYYQIEPGTCKVTFPDLDADAWD